MNILKINGQALEGIYVDAAISFNKPAKRVSTYSVPGRNGDLVIDEGTFDNVLITYPVFEKSTFPTEFDAIVNYLASLEGYQRIECSNDPQHYRLGRFVVPQNPTVKRLNRDGYWQLSFDCKPQRWTLEGEEETEIDNTMVVIASDDTPYLFRKAGGAEDITGADRATLSALTGASVGWNQLVQNGNFASTSGWSSTRGTQAVSNNELTYTVTELGGGALQNRTARSISFPKGHKVFVALEYYAAKAFKVIIGLGGATSREFTLSNGVVTSAWNSLSAICQNDVADVTELRIGSPSTYGSMAVGDTYKFRNVMLIDLTQMLGSAIADAAYAKEQSVAGSGIAWLKSAGFFTKPYYPYDAGSIVSVNTEGRKVVGKNWLDYTAIKTAAVNVGIECDANGNISDSSPTGDSRAYGYSACNWQMSLPAGTYTLSWYCSVACTRPNGNVMIYAEDGANIYNAGGNSGLTVGSHNKTFTLTAPTSIGIFIKQYDAVYKIQLEAGSTSSPWNAYTPHTYPIPSTDLRGITKLTDGKITYDGDTFLPNGTINRKYGIVDLGELTWITTTNRVYSLDLEGLAKLPPVDVPANMIAEKYECVAANGTLTLGTFAFLAINGHNQLYFFYDGVNKPTGYLVYELATPTTEDGGEWQGVELVYPEGTEQFIDERTVPFAVGHDTDYFNHIGYVINNPTHFTSKPLIRVYGDGTFTVNNTTVIIAAHTEPYIDIDCELQECFYEDTNMNSYVSFSDNDFPELVPGANGFMPTPGITKLIVTPRWWIL